MKAKGVRSIFRLCLKQRIKIAKNALDRYEETFRIRLNRYEKFLFITIYTIFTFTLFRNKDL